MSNNFKIKAIKDNDCLGFTKGKIYEFVNGTTEWDDGFKSCKYNSYEDFCNRNVLINKDFILICEDNKLTGIGLINLLINKNVNIGDKFKCSNGEEYVVVLINNDYYTLYESESEKEVKLSLFLSNSNITFKNIAN